MSDNIEKDKSPEVVVLTKEKQALEGNVAMPSTSKKASSSSSTGAKEKVSVKKTKKRPKLELPKIVASSPDSSISSMEGEKEHTKITIIDYKVEKQFVKYLYALEGDHDLDTYWSDDEVYIVQTHEDGTPKRRQTFTYPIFNEKSSEIYSQHIKKDSKYFMKIYEKRKIKTELFDINTNESINLRMFKEIAETLHKPTKIIEIGEECEVMVCGSIKNTKEAFLSFDVKTMILVRYLLRLAAQSSPNLASVELKDIDTKIMYAVADRKNNEYTRVILSENHERKTKYYRDFWEKNRIAQVEREKTVNLSEDERQRRAEERRMDTERDSETVVFLSVDTGMERPYHKSVIYRLSDLCDELRNVPYQANKVVVKSLDKDPEFSQYYLSSYFSGKYRLMAKRCSEETDDQGIYVHLQSIETE